MRRQDKKINMERANKSFQARTSGVDETKNAEKERKITYVPDFYPELSKLMN